MTWDEENRLMGINDNGRIHQYTYDAAGERIIKSSGGSQNVAINGETAATITHTDDYTAYVSAYFVISKGKFTKHYFEGAGRIVSKIGNGSFAQPLGITAGGVNYTALTTNQQMAIDNYVRDLGVPPGPPTQQGIYATPEFTGDAYPNEVLNPVQENEEPPQGWPRNPAFNAPGDVPGPPVQFGPPVQPATVLPAEGFTGIGLPENDIFYYHPDHLGSTSYITDKNGAISQHVEYIAFGEVLFEEHSSSYASPYLFNGKELDRETNLSYYGARYLDMKTSLWLSVDPLATYNPIFEDEFYLDGQHNGGVYNTFNLASYAYTYQNPIKFIDPNGKQNTAPPLLGNSSTQTLTVTDYISYFESKTNTTLSSNQLTTLSAGCIGITAINIGIQGTLTTSNAPKLSNAFSTFSLAQQEASKMEIDIQNNPQNYAPGSHVVIFSKRFWSEDPKKFLPNSNGVVDMTTYDYSPRPPIDSNGRGVIDNGDTFLTNFDYGLFDPSRGSWFHANHSEPGMKVYESKLQHYSRPLLDFNRQIFVPEISTIPLTNP